MTYPKEISYLYEYPLTADSRVVEIGAYHGHWVKEMSDRYQCKIWAFEPCGQFYQEAAKNIGERKNVHLINAAVGATERLAFINVKGSMTGEFVGEGESEQVKVIPAEEVLSWCMWGISLMSLNCEGGEFEILETLLSESNQLIRCIEYLQVQFHPIVPNCEERYYKIRAGLERTHKLLRDDQWTWQIWVRK